MEYLLTKKEAEVLDTILESLKGKQFSSAEYDFPLLNPTFKRGQNNNSNAYLPYLKILESFGDIVEVVYNGGVDPCVKPTLKTIEFYDNGGFRLLYEKQQSELEERMSKDELEKSNLKLGNKQLTFIVGKQKPLYILTILGVVLSLASIVIAILSLINSK